MSFRNPDFPLRDSTVDIESRYAEASKRILDEVETRRHVKLSRVAQVARDFDLPQASLLRQLEIMGGCTIDMAKGEIRCQSS